MKSSQILITPPSSDYELLDSGDGEKLERFGPHLLSRPDPQALWPKRLDPQEWKKADAYFVRNSERAEWTIRNKLPDRWPIEFGGLKFWIKPTAFKHVGLFPEQQPNWEWIRECIPAVNVEILNLFGYTGGATLACAQAGAKVVHVDGSKAAVTWARENAELSGLKDKPVRWITEDARLFVEREIRRGRMYDGIIMDPPAFGHGPESELWKIEEHFLPLIDNCRKLLKPDPLFFLINGYSAGYSAVAYENNLLPLKAKFGGEVEIGELAIEEKKQEVGSREKEEKSSHPSPRLRRAKEEGGSQVRLLPAGIFARWSR